MVRLQLDEDLEAIVPTQGRNLTQISYDLIRVYAARDGGLHELMAAALEAVPTNLKLIAVVAELKPLRFRVLPQPKAQRTLSREDEAHLHNRQNVLQNMQSTWIDGYLRHTVHEEVYLLLGMDYQLDAVQRRPWQLELQPEETPVPESQSIHDIYVEHGRNLLILGEPASGKTITLLQLAEALILEAEVDDSAPIPIVVNLSSWARERLPLTDWLVEELLLQYQIARDLTREWIAQSQIALLLDGLDEVAADYREACVEAINRFKADSAISLVVCSRSADYANLQQQLNLSTAIVLKPLTERQIDQYLQEFGSRTAGIQEAIQNEPPLRELAQSPLMLSLIPVAYDGVDYQNLASSTTIQEHRNNLLDRYVQRVLASRPFPNEGRYNKQQALTWLINLAKGMRENSQSIFYIELLQPTWIAEHNSSKQYRLYSGLISGIFCGLIVGLLYTLFMLVYGVIVGQFIPLGSAVGVILGMLLIAGATVGVLVWKDDRTISVREELYWSSYERPHIKQHILNGLKTGIRWGIFSGFALWVVFGVIGMLIRGKEFHLLLTLFGGLFIGIYFGFMGGVIGALIGGVSSFVQVRKTSQNKVPNQGIYASLKNGVRYAGIFGAVVLVICGLLYGLFFGLRPAMINFLYIGVTAGFLMYGGKALIQHYALRFLMARQNILPYPFRDKRLIAYLDAMAERVLLRRVGGGWIFIHRYLLEYFAEQHPSNQTE